MEILLIEDTEDDADYINELLSRMPGFQRKAAVRATLAEANETLKCQHFDVIILDINLPDSSGLETFESIKRVADRTPIVILTGQEDERLAFEAVRLGAQDYLFKNALTLEGMRRALMYAIERQRAFDAISLLATIVDSCTDAVASESLDGTILTWNRGATELYGYKQEEAVGRKTHDLLKSKQLTPFPDIVEELIKNGRWQDQFARHTKDGREIIVSSRWALRRDSTGQPLMILELSNDITESSTAEAQAKHLGAIVESSDDAIIGKNLEGIITSWNQGAERLYGYTKEETIGRSIAIIAPCELEAELQTMLESIRQGHIVETFDTRRRKKNGELVDVSLSISTLKDHTGKVIGASAIARDISLRKQTEAILLKANEDLERKVDERTSELVLLNGQLTVARDQAQNVSRLKSEFVANMSHEIRTPLNAIIGMANVLQKTNLEEKQSRYAAAIQESGQSLLRVINDILDFSKIEAGKIELVASDFDLLRVVESTCTMFGTQARAKGLSFLSFVDQSLPERLSGDSERLRQILTNLIGNAIKFSDEGEVALKVTAQEIHANSVTVRFAVTDAGIGLSEENQARLFQPFVQADGSTSRKYGGTGLGLSISRTLVELMNGEIGVTSVAGEGATFWCNIPFETRSDLPLSGKKEDLENVRILLVDDEPFAREILQAYATSWGMRSGVASNGRKALTELRKAYAAGDPYKVVIIDLVMPDMSGYELGAEIMRDVNLNNTRLILLTAFDNPSAGTKAVELGFGAFLTKPMRQSEILECVTDAVCSKATKRAQCPPAGQSKVVTYSKAFQTSELILLAEDHKLNQEVARLYLEELGLKCHIVKTGKEALDAMERNRYALVLMDCQMPEMDGFAATAAIRKREVFNGQHMPIIAVTANAMKEDRENCLSAGMDDYISKPIDPKELQEVLQKWLPQALAQVSASASASAIHSSIKKDYQTNDDKGAIDFEKLQARYSLEDRRRLLTLFLDSVPEEIDKFKTAVEESDLPAISASIHGLKGICAGMAAGRMKEVCVSIESLVDVDDFDGLRRLTGELERAFQQVQAQIDCRN